MIECPTCQGPCRRTTDMVCMDCGRDYMQQEPDGSFTPDDRLTPGIGWKRLMLQWRECYKKLEAETKAPQCSSCAPNPCHANCSPKED